MNPMEKQIEKQMQIGRSLVELSAQWTQKMVEFDVANVQKFIEMNTEYASRLPNVADLQSFAELQREYGETLWNTTQEVFQARAEMVQEAAAEAGELMRSAFEPAVEVEVKAKPAPKKRATRSRKTTAKKAA